MTNRSYYPWLEVAKGHMEAAILCCQELQNPIRNRGEADPENNRYEARYYFNLISPIMFGAKHGAEVFLKSMLEQMGEPDDQDHNILKLFDKAIILVRSGYLYVVKNADAETALRSEVLEKLLNKDIPDAKEGLEYFFNNRFLGEATGCGDIPDPGNQLFRYPYIKMGTVNTPELIAQLVIGVPLDRISALKMRIGKLERALLNIGYVIAVANRHGIPINARPASG